MDLGINEKVALVAASSTGIGYAVARGLAAEGARLVICSRNADRIGQAAASIEEETGAQVLAVEADLTTEHGPAKVVDHANRRFGQVDILVTNTGGPPSMPYDELSSQQFSDAFQLLFMSAQRLIDGCLAGMKERGWGRVISITSSACSEPIQGLALSNSVRVSIHGLLKTLSQEYGAYGITFNALQPGFTWTDRVQQLASKMGKSRGVTAQEVVDSWFASIPMGRAGTPYEIASAALYLASRQAAFINGTTLRVDGGRGKHIF